MKFALYTSALQSDRINCLYLLYMKMSVEKAKFFGGMIHLAWFRHQNRNELCPRFGYHSPVAIRGS